MKKIAMGDGTPEEPYIIESYRIGITDKWESEPFEYFPQQYDVLSEALERLDEMEEPEGDAYYAIVGFLEDGTAVYVADEETL